MKKITTIILLLCLFWTNCIIAQNNKSIKYEGRPMPDWVMGATPEPHNNSYYYKVFDAANADREEARNQAIRKAFQQAISFIDATVESADVFNAVAKGENLNVVSETYHIPIYFTCEFAKKSPDGTQWIYWILCQIAVRGYGNSLAQFDLHFTDCNTHDIWDKGAADIKRKEMKEMRSDDAKAFFASMFIPGMGQMIKGSKYGERKYVGEGVGILISEIVLLGAGSASYLYAQKQNDLIKGWGVDYNTYNSAQKKKKIFTYTSYGCFGAAVVIWGVNLYRACAIKKKDYAFYPTVIPTTNNDYAFGVGGTIKF